MRSVVSHSTSRREKEGHKERTGLKKKRKEGKKELFEHLNSMSVSLCSSLYHTDTHTRGVETDNMTACVLYSMLLMTFVGSLRNISHGETEHQRE